MKTKPNFTYKEFIEKISTVQLNNKDKPEKKSPRALKSHNKNIPQSSQLNASKALQKKPFPKKVVTNREVSQTAQMNQIKSPRKVQIKQSQCFPTSKATKTLNQKSTTNKKLKLKNTSQSSNKHTRSTMQQGKDNFFNNESFYQDERHNESYSPFMKNSKFNNEQQNSFGFVKSPSQIRLKTKKPSAGSIDTKFKLANTKGNLTERYNQRINTEHESHVISKPSDRLNTYYERPNSQYDQQSPSFYRMSIDNQSSFLQFQQDRTSKPLFAQTSRSKKSKISVSLQQQKPKINQKSHQYIYNKFIGIISKVLFEITRIQDQSLLLEHKIKYIEYLESLKQLKMIRSDYEPYQTEGVDLVRQLWEELIMGHNINHFIVILSIIMKITPIQHLEIQNPTEAQNYIYLQKKYEQFRFTRLQLDRAKTYSQKESMQYYNFPFQPTISKASQQLASRSKSQRKYKINTSINHNQSLNLLSKRQNTSINTQFQPHHNQSVNLSTTRQTSPLGNKRSQILYKQAKKKSLQKRQDKSTVDYEFQKNKNQLTFKPKITIKKKIKQSEQSTCQYMSPRFAIDEEKTINRMIRGRVEKQVKQITIDRGLPYNEKTIDKLRKQKFQEIFRQQQESHLKTCHNESRTRPSPHHNKSNQRCTTQVQNLQNIMQMSFQEHQDQNIQRQQPVTQRIQSSPAKVEKFKKTQQQQSADENFFNDPDSQQSTEDCFVLDIYFEEDRWQKIKISRNATIEEVISEAEKFVKKHNLPKQMQRKLKNELLMVTRFSDIQDVIQQNAEQDQCSLLM